MEVVPQTQDIIENFLNGHYMEFLSSLNTVSSYLRYDVFFGHRLHYFVGTIRKKALVQYVTPYKVIDMREIAKAFNLTIEQIEVEIAELIVSNKIQAKIDSHSKVRNSHFYFYNLFENESFIYLYYSYCTQGRTMRL